MLYFQSLVVTVKSCSHYAGWASRTFFSDNGSTAIEVALKMAFRKFSLDHGIILDSTDPNATGKFIEVKVLFNN